MQSDGITELLLAVGDGQFDDDAGAKMAELVAECSRAARQKNGEVSGSVKIQINVKVNPNGVVGIGASVSKTTPKIPAQPMVRFIGKNGQLLTAPENQQVLPFSKKNPMEDEVS